MAPSKQYLPVHRPDQDISAIWLRSLAVSKQVWMQSISRGQRHHFANWQRKLQLSFRLWSTQRVLPDCVIAGDAHGRCGSHEGPSACRPQRCLSDEQRLQTLLNTGRPMPLWLESVSPAMSILATLTGACIAMRYAEVCKKSCCLSMCYLQLKTCCRRHPISASEIDLTLQ